MTERFFDPQVLQRQALDVVDKLKETAQNHERRYPLQIQAVVVFSGPGTYYDRLKPGQQEWQRWMDRDRIRAGVAVVREITARVKSRETGRGVFANDIQKEDIAKHGPFFVYNGIPLENEVFRQALKFQWCKLPREKVLIIDEVREPKAVRDIGHTGDQYESFFQELRNPTSPLFGIRDVALVAHIPDFIRHPFYAKHHNNKYIEEGYPTLTFWAYALKSRPGTENLHLEAELPRLVTYAQHGHLATEPVPLSV